MERPTTQSRPYCVRIPLELEAALHQRADANGLTPAVYLKALVVRHLRPKDPT